MTRLLCGASLLALATIPVIAPQRAHAQDALDLDMITVYANQSDLPLSRTGASVDVIEQDQLDSAPGAGLTDILSGTPGVTFTQSGGPGGLSYGSPSNVRMRGLDQKYAPVLLNGIDISDPSSTQTGFDWNNLLSGGMSRAEIVRGTQSALYGSEAVAGVIALTAAKAPEEAGRSGRIGVEFGSYGTRRATLSYGIASDRAGLAFTAARARSDGFSTFSDNSEKDGYAGGQYSFDLYYDVLPELRLGLTGFSFDSEFDYDPGDNTGDTLQRGVRAYLQAQTGDVSHEFDVSRFTIDRDLPLSFTPNFEGEREKFGYTGTWTASPMVTVSYGADWTRETADSFTNEDVDVRGLFGEVQYAPTPDLDLALSVRHDDNSQFGGFTTGRAALTWRLRDDMTLRSTLANGFRAPSLNELYGSFGANPDLDPEQSRSFDLGLEKTFANGGSLTATVFYTEIDDLIDYPVSSYVQIDGTSVSQGVELSGRLPVTDRVTLTGAFTYTDARDEDDEPLQRVPRYVLDLGIAADITDRITAAASLQRRADLPPTFGATAVEDAEDYTVVNARIGYDFGNNVEAYIRVENLFDQQYEVIPGYRTSDRAAYFGVVASF